MSSDGQDDGAEFEEFDPSGDTELPGDDDSTAEASSPALEAPDSSEISFEPFEVTLKLELDHFKGGFVGRSLDDARMHTSRISPEQAIALKMLYCSLNARDERLASNRHVQHKSDAVKWLLDQVVAAIPPEVMEACKASATG